MYEEDCSPDPIMKIVNHVDDDWIETLDTKGNVAIFTVHERR